MRGRKPKPTALKKLAGNPGKRPLNENEARVERAVMYAPRGLGPEAKKEWRRVAKILYDAGLFTAADRSALMVYCMAYGRMVQADAIVRERGMVVKTTAGNIIQNPYLSIVNKQAEIVTKLAAEFGMTPSSRSRIQASPPEREMSLAEMLFVEAGSE